MPRVQGLPYDLPDKEQVDALSKIPFVDCQGLAGAWTLGTVRTGQFDLVGRKTLPGGFGDVVVEDNRHLLPGDWGVQVGDPHSSWDPEVGVGYLCGTPPCSGFSLLNRSKGKNARGASSDINTCMRELVTYASTCTGLDGQPGPEIVSFESVQGAYSAGRDLMLSFRDILGERYTLHHVLMSGSSVGSAQMRHRYFPVFARIPFGVDTPSVEDLPEGRVVTYDDAIGDLWGSNEKLQWEGQPYRRSESEWVKAKGLRPGKRFENHVTVEKGWMKELIEDVCDRGWTPGFDLPRACIELGYRPERIERSWIPEEEQYRGWNWPMRPRPDRPGYVLTGSGMTSFIHPRRPRNFTVAECSRLMGYPDDWSWRQAKNPGMASMWIGKCCPVQSGQWISDWVARAIREEPGAAGEAVGERETKHNFTLLYKKWPGGNVPPRYAKETR